MEGGLTVSGASLTTPAGRPGNIAIVTGTARNRDGWTALSGISSQQRQRTGCRRRSRRTLSPPARMNSPKTLTVESAHDLRTAAGRVRRFVRRLRARWIIFGKTRRLARMIRWLGCDSRLGLRMTGLLARGDGVFAWRWFERNCRRMQRLNDKWGYCKATNAEMSGTPRDKST